MASNNPLSSAKLKKNDEFYTQYADIEKEVNAYLEYDADVFRGKTILLPCDDPEWSNFTIFFAQNFERLGLKKLISTSYAVESKNFEGEYIPSEFEQNSPLFDWASTRVKGKIFVLEKDITGDGKINHSDLEWSYLEGDGDFRSEEVCKLRDEADIIITNPPFSLFRDFLAWATAVQGKGILMIGNLNAITYKELFPLIMGNRIWLGATGNGTDMVFGVPAGAEIREADRQKAERLGYKGNYTRLGNSCWFTNLEHGKRHRALELMTLEENLKYSRHKEIRGASSYLTYDNYDALEVPFTDAIPSDYEGVMGVPITFLDKYCPEQFEIVGMCENEDLYGLKTKMYKSQECKDAYYAKFGKKGTYDLNATGVVVKEGILEKVFKRILIKKVQAQ